jgi:hypothetical protein
MYVTKHLTSYVRLHTAKKTLRYSPLINSSLRKNGFDTTLIFYCMFIALEYDDDDDDDDDVKYKVH